MSETKSCAACQMDAEEREACSSDCRCVRLAEEKASGERMHKAMADAACALAFGIEGSIPRDTAYADAFLTLYGHLYGRDEAVRILAEGVRHV